MEQKIFIHTERKKSTINNFSVCSVFHRSPKSSIMCNCYGYRLFSPHQFSSFSSNAVFFPVYLFDCLQTVLISFVKCGLMDEMYTLLLKYVVWRQLYHWMLYCSFHCSKSITQMYFFFQTQFYSLLRCMVCYLFYLWISSIQCRASWRYLFSSIFNEQNKHRTKCIIAILLEAQYLQSATE